MLESPKKLWLIIAGVVLALATFFLLSRNANAQNEGLTPEKLWAMGRIGDEQVSPDGRTVLYGITRYNIAENTSLRQLYTQQLNSAGDQPSPIKGLEGSAYNARWRPDGARIGFLSASSGSMQLWEVLPDGTGLRQVTNIEGGIDNFAYSPNQAHISFTVDVKLDQTVNDLYPDLPLANARIIDDLMYRHWNQWHDFAYTHVCYATYPEGGAMITEYTDIMEGERYDSPLKPFGGTECISWKPDGSAIAYVSKKVNGKEYAVSTNSDIYLYTLATGSTSNLTEGRMGYDTEPTWNPDGTRLAFMSMERNGFESDQNVLYVYDTQSKQFYNISDPMNEGAVSVGHPVWTANGKKIYCLAGIQATYQILEADVSKLGRVTKAEDNPLTLRQVTQGNHNINSVQVAGSQLLVHKNSMQAPADLYTVTPKNGAMKPLTQVNKELLAATAGVSVEERWVATTDGKKMKVWVILPPNFDANKKYPALLYCQGGPQSAVSQFFSYRWNFYLMASQGYVVVAPNRRGLPSFGQEWNDAISGDWGGQAMKDYLAAIDEVAKEPYVDENRLGAVGASYGGYSIYYLAGIHEGRFKTFISHCGLFNLESWYGSTEEMFFANWDMKGPYWANPQPKSYEAFSPHKFVGNWDTPMLVIHGEKDFRVPITQGMEAFNAAQLQGIESRFLYFPTEGHWVQSPQNGVLWHRVFYEWLDKYLK